MKFTQVATDAFQKFQLNAGVLLSDFDPATGTLVKEDIIGATGGGTSFTATPEFLDFGDDIDNVPANTMELKQIDSYTVTMSGTFKTVDTDVARMLVAAADVAGNKITPRHTLSTADFADIWWVGDYSDVNTDSGSTQKAGFVAIHMMNALSTGGFSIQSNDKGKGDFSFEFTGHYSLNDPDTVPFEIYVKDGASGTTN